MRKGFLFSGAVMVAWLLAGGAHAADKNGVSPQVISLPSGPGSIQGLGESFQPQLNSGSGSFSVPIQLPSAATGFAPGLSLDYHTGQGNGILGIGWKLSGPTMISRNMDHGLPFYIDGPNGIDDDFDGVIDNPGEIDRFSGVSLEELIPLADGSLRSENEGSFARYRRVGEGWTVQEKSGVLNEFGVTGEARLENNGRMFAWLLKKTTDPNGNAAEYSYITDAGSPGQKYLREVRWARPQAFYAAVLSYDASRPDVHADFKSGFEIRTRLRLSRIDVIAQGVPPSPTALVGDFNGDGLPDSLIRRYEIEYETNTLVSRLSRVTLRGADGVTALPSISFQYTNWTPPHEVVSSFTLSTGDPEVGLNSPDVELIDMNQDGLPDLLHAAQGLHRVYFNHGMNELGRLAWDTIGTLVGNAPGLNLGLSTVHLADHSADGESDLIHKVNDSTFQCYLNSGQGSWQTPVTLGNTDTWPLWPFQNSGSRTLDADHNRLHDILFTGDNSYRLWMMMPGGRYGREVPLPVLSDGTQAFRFEDPGARIADVNGDRINDLAWIQSKQVVYWASCGRGAFDGPIFLPIDGSLLVSEIPRVDLADINGDALSDLVVVRPQLSPEGIHYFVNHGLAGFGSRRSILGLPFEQSGDTARCADMNGNGSVDFLISNSNRGAGTKEQFLDFVPGVRPNLLTRIENGLGSVTTLHYESSVDQMVRAREAGTPWESTMPISMPVVARIVESDSRGNDFVRELTYRNPHFDSDKQEFRGFTSAEAREIGDASTPTRVMTSTFDNGTQASCRKGMVISQEVTDAAGSRFDRVENTVDHRLIANSLDGRQVCFAFNEAVDTFIFEQSSKPAHLRAEYQFDDFGNTLHENKMGVVGQSGDEQFLEKAFAYDFENWRLDRIARSTTRDGDGARVAEDRFTYDTRGNLLEHRRWLNLEDRFVLAVRNEYDDFGNVIRMFDANGHSRSIVFDSLLHTYPVSEIVHLESRELVTTAEYDTAVGTVVSAVDFGGATTTYQYDPLARLIAILKPGGARTTYEYTLGNPLSRIATRILEDQASGGTFDTYDYFDGFGRKLGSKIEAEKGRWRFVDAVAFNNRKLEITRWLPYFTANNEYETPDSKMPFNATFYDSQGRVARRVNPDGTESRVTYGPLVQHRFDEIDTAGAATPLTQRNDGLDRLVEVVERNASEEYHSRYTWNPLGLLVEVVDSQGNKKSLVYDSLQRTVAMNDPDRGILSHEYDDVGNMKATTDARGQTTVYVYDFANRLIAENYLDQGGGPDDPVDVRMIYDVPSENVDFGDGTSGTTTFTGGRVAAVFDLSGEEHRSYDARGNPVWTAKRIRDPQLGVFTSYKTAFAYDPMDRIVDLVYPDNDRCRYTYNSASLPERLDGGPTGRVIVADSNYTPSMRLSQISFGDGVTTTSVYDRRDRLASLRTTSPLDGDLLHYSYTFDPVSNIVGIDDLRPMDGPHGVPADSPRRNTQRFEYDDLYRLRRARYTPVSENDASLGTIDLTYDPLCNMVSQISDNPKAHLGAMTYGGGRFGRIGRQSADPPGPHALTSTESGGVYEYDEIGNMTRVDGATLSWDFKNRLVRFQNADVDARYTYDYMDRRITKFVTQAGRAESTIYVDQYFEYRPDRAPIKYVFDGASRVAQVSDTLDPLRPRLQRIWLFEGWNLLTLAVETLQSPLELFGAGTTVYEWTGKDYRLVGEKAFLPIGTPLWVEVESARVVVARGPYNPPTSPVALPAGPALLAWPRLEPFAPDRHLLTVDVRVQAHDPQQARWLLRDLTLPPLVGDLISSLPPSTAMWLDAPNGTMLLPGATSDRGTLFFHGDHLGSAQLVTDQKGVVLQETYFFPFGEPRHSHEPGALLRQPYGFTHKERDTESGLHYFDARFLAGRLARFATVDPKYVHLDSMDQERIEGYLAQPQDLNLYAYARNNPIRYVDPTGLGILDFYVENVWHPAHDDWDDIDWGRTLKVMAAEIQVVGGAVGCGMGQVVGCASAVSGIDDLQAEARGTRPVKAQAAGAMLGDDEAGDVAGALVGALLGGGNVTGIVAKAGNASKLGGAGANAFTTTAKATTGAGKAEAATVATTTAKTTTRAKTIPGTAGYTAKTKTPQPLPGENLSTYSTRTNPKGSAQTNQQWNARTEGTQRAMREFKPKPAPKE